MPHQVPVVTTVPAGTVWPSRVAWRSQAGSTQTGSPIEWLPRNCAGAAPPIVTVQACADQSRGANGTQSPSTSAPCDCRSASFSSAGAFTPCCQRESTISIDTAMASTRAVAPSWVNAAACSGVTAWPRRSAISTSISLKLKGQVLASAGLAQTPAAGSGAWVASAMREGPPDFQWPDTASAARSLSTRAWTA